MHSIRPIVGVQNCDRVLPRGRDRRSIRGARLCRWVLLLALVGTVDPTSVFAEPVGNPPPPPPIVTTETIEVLRKQAAESTELDADTKQKIETACTQAQECLKLAAKLTAQAEQFKRDADDVQLRAEQLRRRLVELQGSRITLPSTLSLPELEQEVSRRDVALADLKAAQARSEAEAPTRANRRREIREFLLSASQRITDVQQQLDAPTPAEEPPLLTSARRSALQARRLYIEAEQPALQNELAKYDAEDAVDFLRLERDVYTQEVTVASTELASLRGLLSRRRAADSAAAVERAWATVTSTPASLAVHAHENVTFAEAAQQLSQPMQETLLKLEKTKTRLEEIQKQFAAIQQRVNDIGLTGSIGALLRRQRIGLPDLRRRQQNVQDRKTRIEDMQYSLFDYEDLRSESNDAAVQRMLSDVAILNPDDKEILEATARTLAEQRREFLDGVIRNLNSYLDMLFELDATEQRLIRETELFEDYIDERVLWIRSNRTLLSAFDIDTSDMWAFQPSKWAEVGQRIQADAQEHALIYVVALFTMLVLLWRKAQFRRELAAISQVAERGTCTSFALTMRAGFLTLMLAIAWPGLLAFVAWRLNVAANGTAFTRAVSQALFAVAWVYFPLELLRRVCRKRGLADSHFDWPPSTIAVFRGNLLWATLFGLLIVFTTSLLYSSDPEHGLDTMERVCFVMGMLALSLFLRRVLRPDRGIFREYLAAHQGGWLDRLKPIWYRGCVLVPLAVGSMTIAGYYYTAQHLSWRLYASFVLIVVVQLIRAFLQRLLLVHRRAISIQQAKDRRAADAALREQAAEPTPQGPRQIVPLGISAPDLDANTQQSARLIHTGLIAVSLVGMWLVWVDVLPALRFLNQWPVWTTTVTEIPQSGMPNGIRPGLLPSPMSAPPVAAPAGQATDVVRTVTVADLGLALLIGIVTFVCARNIPGLMELSVLQRLPLDNSIRYAITSVTSYAIVLLGVICAFNAISVGWSKVQWLATALTFGLAFGLQEIFANFVAGLILLFERPIRVGDVVTVDEITGVVSRIRIRATTITNWDRKEYVIPNKEFITGRSLNWTLSDKTNRVVINVGVAYGSDVERAKQLLSETCESHPLILKDPPTRVTFEGFGDNSLNLVVRAFLPDLDNRLMVIDQLHTSIDKAFRQAGVEIAFPQRDLHLRSVDKSVIGLFGEQSKQKAA